jgi:hypothetical protein
VEFECARDFVAALARAEHLAANMLGEEHAGAPAVVVEERLQVPQIALDRPRVGNRLLTSLSELNGSASEGGKSLLCFRSPIPAWVESFFGAEEGDRDDLARLKGVPNDDSQARAKEP